MTLVFYYAYVNKDREFLYAKRRTDPFALEAGVAYSSRNA